MLAPLAQAPLSLDASTLAILACCITALLGALLLFVGSRDRMRALAWWGTAYLLGGFAVALWSLEGTAGEYLPRGTPNALLFIACGMMWNAARLFHGRSVQWPALVAGAAAWLLAVDSGAIDSPLGRMMVSAMIIASYTFLTAHELWRERRKERANRRLAIIVPALHGTVFLLPMIFATLLPEGQALVAFSTSWVAIFGLEALLYAVGAAFIVLVLTQDHKVHVHRTAALTDPLTGVLNRRGFLDNAAALLAMQAKRRAPVTVLLFDLDHFKSINDRFGHATGDDALRLFAATASSAMRSDDIFGRIGGEEFAAIVAGSSEDGAVVGERVRFAFELRAVTVGEHDIGGTVSVGVASGRPARKADLTFVETLLARADAALYLAKENGRNRIEIADDLSKETRAAPAPSKHVGTPAAASSIA
ncbi:MAG TPA: GGDEF domain-containing protein [Xanthobacteraceae bacterium]|nr:GGDEF domain-containing protein [Xanthobacteraceae bacterium]